MNQVAIYAATIFLSAMNLFLVQPIIAKQILPWFGGASNVWTTCLFFFQFVLLLGYCYAHALSRLSARAQPLVHGALLLASLALLPIIASAHYRSGEEEPILRLLTLLAATVGLPYFLLASTSPLVQSWYARSFHAPYRLFALSNVASLLGLLIYPLALEPFLTTQAQAWLWSASYAGFVLCCGITAFVGARAPVDARPAEDTAPQTPLTTELWWIALSAMGALILVSVTSFIGASIASAPMIWIAPLVLYLLSFIFAFEGRRSWHGGGVGAAALIFAVAMLALYRNEDFVDNYVLSLPLYLAGLFLICLYCHGQLAEMRPPTQRLTFYYIMIAAGGALGSMGGSVLAPALLPGDFEMPAALTAVGLIVALRFGPPSRRRIVGLGAAAAAMAALAAYQIGDEFYGARLLARNFYSSLRVLDVTLDGEPLRRLEHGGIEHGAQFLSPARRREPISYYSHDSGLGRAILRQRALRGRPLALGVIGLGAGVAAAYGEAGGRVRYYEINPQVVDIAHTQFTYLSDSPAATDVALGDARLVLERESSQQFDVLAVDAFSGDAIPMHLLTREAFAIYRRHLAPGGVIAFHVTNKFVDLGKPLTAITRAEKADARLISSNPDKESEDSALSASDWLIVAPDASWWDDQELAKVAKIIEPDKGQRLWTDDFNNLVSALRLPNDKDY